MSAAEDPNRLIVTESLRISSSSCSPTIRDEDDWNVVDLQVSTLRLLVPPLRRTQIRCRPVVRLLSFEICTSVGSYTAGVVTVRLNPRIQFFGRLYEDIDELA